MLNLIIVISLFSSCIVSANFVREDPNPSVCYYGTPPTPTLAPEPLYDLEPNQCYADPKDNPFRAPGTLVYGHTKVVPPRNLTEPIISDTRALCHTDPSRVEDKWQRHLPYVLYRNRTLQQVSFPLALFKTLDRYYPGAPLSKITRGERPWYDCHKKHGEEHEWGNETYYRDKRFIIGTDDRVEIGNTFNFPFSTVGQVGGGCTGTLIGPRHVLTAGHCVHSQLNETSGDPGSWFTNLDFTFTHRAGFDQPIKKETIPWEKVWSVVGWTEQGLWDYDYALIILNTEKKLPWMSFGYHTGLGLGWYMNANGYHADKVTNKATMSIGDTMWNSYGPVILPTDLQFEHELDLIPGLSGGGVYRYLGTSRIIYGVQSTHWYRSANAMDPYNRATRINKFRFWQICGWINDPRVC